jgi:hypothetical protein
MSSNAIGFNASQNDIVYETDLGMSNADGVKA